MLFKVIHKYNVAYKALVVASVLYVKVANIQYNTGGHIYIAYKYGLENFTLIHHHERNTEK